MATQPRLSSDDHDRDGAGMTYVYPVVSRRARGVSIGVDLNTNQACNWRCVYCQVPELVYGNAPQVDVELLGRELEALLRRARSSAWMERHVPEGARQLRDVALAGNGEPTSSKQLAAVVERIGTVLAALGLADLRVVLITNGSLVHLAHVGAALARLAALGGEVWFKLDAASDAALARINGAHAPLARARANLELSARACPTWVQTLAFDFDGPTLAGEEERAYCALLNDVRACGAQLEGVRLYGLARPSRQPEAARLRSLPAADLEALGRRIAAATGLAVQVSA